MFDPKLKEALSRVQKPGRYTGGEPGSVYKNKDEVDVRFAFCFPDTYEIGMSNLGVRILYHCLNLHSVFQKGTIEFRLFNSTTHAGKVKTYIQFCLAISGQALNQTCAATRKTTSTNEKYTFRTWLLRLGMIGDEFKTARKFLLENLEGGIAWKDPESLRASEEAVQEEPIEEAEECQEQGMNLSL